MRCRRMVWSAAVSTLASAKAIPLNQQVRTGQGVVVSGGRRLGHEPVEVRTLARRADYGVLVPGVDSPSAVVGEGVRKWR